MIIEALEALGSRKVPTRALHSHRNDFNFGVCDNARLYLTREVWYPKAANGNPKRCSRPRPVYYDNMTGTRWILQPWYLSMFHAPATHYKLLSLDSDLVSSSKGSSEIIVRKRHVKVCPSSKCQYFNGANIETGSYNFCTSGWRHWLADILPVVIYCKCIGE